MRFFGVLLLLALSLFSPSARAQPSVELRVELLTIEPGAEIWERFAHTALRVHSSAGDVVFSYGAAPFLEPSFMWAFARGEGDFFVLAERFPTTLRRYVLTDRTMYSQTLNLAPEQNRWLARQLFAAIRPPNNRYRYDQQYVNCATRVRDLIDTASGGALTRAAKSRHPDRSFRDYTLEAMAGHPGAHWALDLLGGTHQDLPVDGYHEMYLPLFLRDRVAEARLSNGAPLASPSVVLNTRKAAPARSPHWYTARIVLLVWSAVVLALVLIAQRLQWLRKVAASAAFAFTLMSGVFGLLVVPMTLISRVQNFSPNENAWLFSPLDLFVAPLLYRAVLGRARPSRLALGYLALRSLSITGLFMSKVVGLATQHNWTYVVIALVWSALISISLRASFRSQIAALASPPRA